ncbi:hypothetical protein Pelo_16909 [Pelomyxa schiedti]|nr:hypothetical protein Pelo_16909 [Pelomyxa schiedti]
MGRSAACSADSHHPRPVPALRDEEVAWVSAGGLNAAALSKEGDVYVWGTGKAGQLGLGKVVCCHVPQKLNISGAPRVISVECGNHYSILLTESRSVMWWGTLGPDPSMQSFSPIPAQCEDGQQLFADKICAGYYCPYAISKKDTSVYSWGWGTGAFHGHGHLSCVQHPTKIPPLEGLSISTITCGEASAFAIEISDNQSPQGVTKKQKLTMPTEVSFLGGVIKQAVCGAKDCIALTETGDVLQWTSGENIFIKVINQQDVIQISAGRFHFAAITRKGVLLTWGLSSHGCLAHGMPQQLHDSLHSVSPMVDPAPVTSLQTYKVAAISCGDSFNVAIVTRNELAPSEASSTQIQRMKQRLGHTMLISAKPQSPVTPTGYPLARRSNSSTNLLGSRANQPPEDRSANGRPFPQEGQNIALDTVASRSQGVCDPSESTTDGANMISNNLNDAPSLGCKEIQFTGTPNNIRTEPAPGGPYSDSDSNNDAPESTHNSKRMKAEQEGSSSGDVQVVPIAELDTANPVFSGDEDDAGTSDRRHPYYLGAHRAQNINEEVQDNLQYAPHDQIVQPVQQHNELNSYQQPIQNNFQQQIQQQQQQLQEQLQLLQKQLQLQKTQPTQSSHPHRRSGSVKHVHHNRRERSERTASNLYHSERRAPVVHYADSEEAQYASSPSPPLHSHQPDQTRSIDLNIHSQKAPSRSVASENDFARKEVSSLQQQLEQERKMRLELQEEFHRLSKTVANVMAGTEPVKAGTGPLSTSGGRLGPGTSSPPSSSTIQVDLTSTRNQGGKRQEDTPLVSQEVQMIQMQYLQQRSETENLSMQVYNLKKDLITQQHTKELETKKKETLEKNLTQLELEMQKLRSEINDLQRQQEEQSSEATSLKEEIHNGNCQMKEQLTNIANLKSELRILYKNCTRITKEKERIELKLQQLHVIETKGTTALQHLKQTLSELHNSVHTTNTSIAEAQAEIDKLSTEEAKLQESLKDLKGKSLLLQDSTASLSTQIQAITAECLSLEQETKEKEHNLTAATNRCSKLTSELHKIESSQSSTQENVDKLSKQLQKARTSVSQLNESVEHLNKALEQETQKEGKLKSEQRHLNGSLEEKRRSLRDAEQLLARTRMEQLQISAQLEASLSDIETSKVWCSQLRTQLQSAIPSPGKLASFPSPSSVLQTSPQLFPNMQSTTANPAESKFVGSPLSHSAFTQRYPAKNGILATSAPAQQSKQIQPNQKAPRHHSRNTTQGIHSPTNATIAVEDFRDHPSARLNQTLRPGSQTGSASSKFLSVDQEVNVSQAGSVSAEDIPEESNSDERQEDSYQSQEHHFSQEEDSRLQAEGDHEGAFSRNQGSAEEPTSQEPPRVVEEALSQE